MLNEFTEYGEYTACLDDTWTPGTGRLNYSDMVVNRYTGLRRAMQIVTRAHMRTDESGRLTNKEELKKLLLSWCGFESQPADEYGIDSWFPKYYFYNYFRQGLFTLSEYLSNEKGCAFEFANLLRVQYDTDSDKAMLIINSLSDSLSFCVSDEKARKECKSELEKLCKIINSLSVFLKKRNRYEKELYASTVNSQIYVRNEMNVRKYLNSLSFERIIAESYSQGKLQRYYLVARRDPFVHDRLRIRTKKKDSPRINDKNRDFLLKLTVAYLLNRIVPDQEYVTYTRVDVANWCGKKADNLDMEKFYIEDNGDYVRLFLIGRHPNFSPITIHPDWVDDFSIVEESELDNVLKQNPTAVFYSDWGSREFLKEGIRY